MSYLKIARMGHPVLRQKARSVSRVGEPWLWTLIQDMYLTMLDAKGVGLAAPQVHHSLRLLVWTPETVSQETSLESVVGSTLINPIIEPIDDRMEVDWEGCLSIPGLRGMVPRYRRVSYRALSPANTHVQGECEGLTARILQHEVDHLDGILYIDRMDDFHSFMFEEHCSRYLRHQEEE